MSIPIHPALFYDIDVLTLFGVRLVNVTLTFGLISLRLPPSILTEVCSPCGASSRGEDTVPSVACVEDVAVTIVSRVLRQLNVFSFMDIMEIERVEATTSVNEPVMRVSELIPEICLNSRLSQTRQSLSTLQSPPSSLLSQITQTSISMSVLGRGSMESEFIPSTTVMPRTDGSASSEFPQRHHLQSLNKTQLCSTPS